MTKFRLEKIALLFSLGLVLGVSGVTYDRWEFWAIMILVMVMDYISTRLGREEGATAVFDLSLGEIQEIKKLYDGKQS